MILQKKGILGHKWNKFFLVCNFTQAQTHKIYCSSQLCDIISFLIIWQWCSFTFINQPNLFFGQYIRTDKKKKKKLDKHPHNASLYNLYFSDLTRRKASSDPQRTAEVSDSELRNSKNKCFSEQLYCLSVTFAVDEAL